MRRAYDRGGKLLMLGVDYESSTYCHVVEVILHNQMLRTAAVAGLRSPGYPNIDRPALGAWWDGQPCDGRSTGKVGAPPTAGGTIQSVLASSLHDFLLSPTTMSPVNHPVVLEILFGMGGGEGSRLTVASPTKVGLADCQLFPIRDFVDACCAEVAANPGLYVHDVSAVASIRQPLRGGDGARAAAPRL